MKDQDWRAIGIVDPRTRGPRDSWTPGLAHINRPAMEYMSTEFGADSSCRFPLRARTNKQTNRRD